MMWSGQARHGRRGAVRLGKARCGMIRQARYSPARFGEVWLGLAKSGMVILFQGGSKSEVSSLLFVYGQKGQKTAEGMEVMV